MRNRRDPESPVGMGSPDIPYDQSGGNEGISGIPSATGGLKSMKLDFADTPQPQIPQGAGVPPSGMEGAIPPAGMQEPMQGNQAPILAGMGGQQPQGMDSSMFSDQDLMGMVGQDFDPTEMQGQQMFDQSMEDPALQQQLMLAAKRSLGGF